MNWPLRRLVDGTQCPSPQSARTTTCVSRRNCGCKGVAKGQGPPRPSTYSTVGTHLDGCLGHPFSSPAQTTTSCGQPRLAPCSAHAHDHIFRFCRQSKRGLARRRFYRRNRLQSILVGWTPASAAGPLAGNPDEVGRPFRAATGLLPGLWRRSPVYRLDNREWNTSSPT